MDANGKDLVEFWNWAAQRGEMGAHTARALRSACKEVLTTVEPDTWESLDLRALDDVDSFCLRFVRLKAGSNFKPDSLTAYQQRFRRALASYLEYLEAPDKWQYGSESPSPTKETSKGKSKPQGATRRQSKPRPGGEKVNPNDPQMLTYPFPVRPWSGLVVNITLPADLTRQEAKRLATFVESLAVDNQPALPSGERQAS